MFKVYKIKTNVLYPYDMCVLKWMKYREYFDLSRSELNHQYTPRGKIMEVFSFLFNVLQTFLYNVHWITNVHLDKKSMENFSLLFKAIHKFLYKVHWITNIHFDKKSIENFCLLFKDIHKFLYKVHWITNVHFDKKIWRFLVYCLRISINFFTKCIESPIYTLTRKIWTFVN